MTDRTKFLDARLFTPAPVMLPGDVLVHVAPLPYAELVRIRELADDLGTEALPALVAQVLCDPHGNPLFNPNSGDDVAAVATKPTPALRAILDAAIEISTPDVEAAKKN